MEQETKVQGLFTDAKCVFRPNDPIPPGGTPAPASAIHPPRDTWANPAREASVSQNL